MVFLFYKKNKKWTSCFGVVHILWERREGGSGEEKRGLAFHHWLCNQLRVCGSLVTEYGVCSMLSCTLISRITYKENDGKKLLQIGQRRELNTGGIEERTKGSFLQLHLYVCQNAEREGALLEILEPPAGRKRSHPQTSKTSKVLGSSQQTDADVFNFS